ncbi:MAG TPA: tetratricopeptide repeat protein [Terriglobales bacterium]|jgi:tetratricopeptide (TPR) repeat protein
MSNEIDQAVQRAFEAQEERHLTDAKSEWSAAVELSRQEANSLALARALRSQGEIERKLHDPEAARLHYEEAAALYRGLSDPLALAHTIRHLGDVYRESHLPELAQCCYREALEIYGAQPEAAPLEVANAIRCMAVLKSELGERDEARKLWEQAREIYTTAGVPDGVAESSARLARLAA